MPAIKVPAALTGGSASTEVTVDGTTLRDAFESHAEAHGPELRDSVIEDGEIREFIHVFVNGEAIDPDEGLDTTLEPTDQIRVVPAASGGVA